MARADLEGGDRTEGERVKPEQCGTRLGSLGRGKRLALVAWVAAAAWGCSSDPDAVRGAGGPRPLPDPIPPHEAAGTCGLEQPAFCEDFAAPHPGGRGGEIDEGVWSFAHWGFAGQFVTFSRGVASSLNHGCDDAGNPVVDDNPSNPIPTFCGEEFSAIEPPGDVRVCPGNDGAGEPSGQLHEVFNTDALPVNSMRVRQPFDFTDRTGTIVFDVDAKRNDGWDGHGWWLELWISEDPVPVPYHGAPTLGSFTGRGAVGFQILPHGQCFDQVDQASGMNTVGRVVVLGDYQVQRDDSVGGDNCFQARDTVLNRFKVLISRERAEFFASDADAPGELKPIVTIDLDLEFSVGYVHLQHVHYNPPKTPNDEGLYASASQTFRWDNIGFDGPTYPTPRGYDVPDALEPLDVAGCNPDERIHAGMSLGYPLASDTTQRFVLPAVDRSGAIAATLNFNISAWAGQTLRYRFNDFGWRTFTVPPVLEDDLLRAFSLDVPLDELLDGENSLEFQTTEDGPNRIGNVDLTIDASG
jgi:hypothetical protein